LIDKATDKRVGWVGQRQQQSVCESGSNSSLWRIGWFFEELLLLHHRLPHHYHCMCALWLVIPTPCHPNQLQCRWLRLGGEDAATATATRRDRGDSCRLTLGLLYRSIPLPSLVIYDLLGFCVGFWWVFFAPPLSCSLSTPSPPITTHHPSPCRSKPSHIVMHITHQPSINSDLHVVLRNIADALSGWWQLPYTS
jgi:hypothetical protein